MRNYKSEVNSVKQVKILHKINNLNYVLGEICCCLRTDSIDQPRGIISTSPSFNSSPVPACTQNTAFAHIFWCLLWMRCCRHIKEFGVFPQSSCHLLSTLNQDASSGTLQPLKLSIQFMAVYWEHSYIFLRIFQFICKVILFSKHCCVSKLEYCCG